MEEIFFHSGYTHKNICETDIKEKTYNPTTEDGETGELRGQTGT